MKAKPDKGSTTTRKGTGSEPFILAIDQSTSATKAILFDGEGRVLDKVSRDHRQIYPSPGWVEHDASEIWKNVLDAVKELNNRHRESLQRCACVSITNQRETVLVFDRKTGKPLHNALVWQDRRGDAVCEAFKKAGHEKYVQRVTGLKIDTYFSASKVKWLVRHQPKVARGLKNGNAVVGTIDSYLVHRLTGGRVFATDYTNASRTLLFDIGKLQWDANLCELFNVLMQALPEVRESAAHFGETDFDGILSRPLPIVGVMGDSQAALFAQRCYEPGMAKATFGTGTSVLLNIGGRLRVSKKGAVIALAWVLNGRATYAFEGIINFSAATIEWLRNQLGLIEDASEVQKLSTAVKDNGGVYLVPAFAGLSAPYWSPEARAAIVGLTAFSRREHIIRAAQEAISYQIRDVLEMMRRDCGIPVRTLYADGGATRDTFLMQFTADLTRAVLRVSDVAESSAWGAAMNGLLGLGVCRNLEDLQRMPRVQISYKPRMNSAVANRLHAGWIKAVQRIL